MTTPIEYRRRYESGESLLDLSLDAACSGPEMRELLTNVGAAIRPKGGARGIHRDLHTPAAHRSTDGATRGRIVRPSVQRMYR